MKIVNTDNFGDDYPDESFVENIGYIRTKEQAEAIAKAINAAHGEACTRFWRVVDDDYILQPGFEP